MPLLRHQKKWHEEQRACFLSLQKIMSSLKTNELLGFPGTRLERRRTYIKRLWLPIEPGGRKNPKFIEHDHLVFWKNLNKKVGALSNDLNSLRLEIEEAGDEFLLDAAADLLINLGFGRKVWGPNSRVSEHLFIAQKCPSEDNLKPVPVWNSAGDDDALRSNNQELLLAVRHLLACCIQEKLLEEEKEEEVIRQHNGPPIPVPKDNFPPPPAVSRPRKRRKSTRTQLRWVSKRLRGDQAREHVEADAEEGVAEDVTENFIERGDQPCELAEAIDAEEGVTEAFTEEDIMEVGGSDHESLHRTASPGSQVLRECEAAYAKNKNTLPESSQNVQIQEPCDRSETPSIFLRPRRHGKNINGGSSRNGQTQETQEARDTSEAPNDIDIVNGRINDGDAGSSCSEQMRETRDIDEVLSFHDNAHEYHENIGDADDPSSEDSDGIMSHSQGSPEHVLATPATTVSEHSSSAEKSQSDSRQHGGAASASSDVGDPIRHKELTETQVLQEQQELDRRLRKILTTKPPYADASEELDGIVLQLGRANFSYLCKPDEELEELFHQELADVWRGFDCFKQLIDEAGTTLESSDGSQKNVVPSVDFIRDIDQMGSVQERLKARGRRRALVKFKKEKHVSEDVERLSEDLTFLFNALLDPLPFDFNGTHRELQIYLQPLLSWFEVKEKPLSFM